MIRYVFDGSFAGLLSAIFEAFERKERQVEMVWEKYYQPNAFDAAHTIHTSDEKAQRVWKGYTTHTDKVAARRFYYAFLSELPEAFQSLFTLACEVFDNPDRKVVNNYGHPDVLRVAQLAKSVSREKHRMEAFVRFKKTADGLYYALIHPDFNVLPLIRNHFKARYADQPWLIYDEKRKYGLYYDTETVAEVTLTFTHSEHTGSGSDNLPVIPLHDEKEALYDRLWKTYFKSVNIAERNNRKLHLQYVPKRYWRYLNEKH